jgi:hypothetical protein
MSILEEAKEAFELCREHEAQDRIERLDDIRFSRLDEQWPEAVRKQRDLEGRPCLTINKLPAFIRQVVNEARQNKPQIKVRPVDSQSDPETAEIISGLIRNIEYTSSADVAYDTGIESAICSGVGYWRVNTEYTSDDTFEQDIVIERVGNPFAVWGDPYSTAADSSDWNCAFDVDVMSLDRFNALYKGADAVDWESDGYTGLQNPWRDGEQVAVAAYWKREEAEKQILLLSDNTVVSVADYEKNANLYQALEIVPVGSPRSVRSHKVTQYTLTGAEELKKVDWAGRFIPIVPVYGDEVNVEGRRIFRSLIRGAKDSQRMFNYWRTAATELVALAPKAPFVGPKGAFETDYAKWETANSQTHSYIEYDGQTPPQRQPFAGIPAGALQEALNASDDMKAILGIYDAGLGARSNETSGVAIDARKRESDVSTFHFIDNLSRAIRHTGRIILDLIPEVYSAPRIIRTLGREGEARPVAINGAEPPPQAEPKPGASEADMMQATARVYDLTAGKYDLAVEAGPSFTTQRQEANEALTELIRAFPQAAPVLADLVLKTYDFPGAQEAADRIAQQAQGSGQPDPDPAQVAQAQEAQAKLQADMAKSQLDAQIKGEELRIKAFEAETDRMKVEHEMRQPARLPRTESPSPQ